MSRLEFFMGRKVSEKSFSAIYYKGGGAGKDIFYE